MGLINTAATIVDMCQQAYSGLEDEQEHDDMDSGLVNKQTVVPDISPVLQDGRSNVVAPRQDNTVQYMSPQGCLELCAYEAVSQTKYLDSANVETIGFGMTQSEIKDLIDWSWTRQLSLQECCDMFKQGLVKYEIAVRKALKVSVTQAQYDALVSITYNIGVGGLGGSTFLRKLNLGYSGASVAASMQNWKYAGGRVVQGLLNRRIAEGNLFVTGQYKNNGTVALITVDDNHKPHYSSHINIAQYF